jgi:hypothetical protein
MRTRTRRFSSLSHLRTHPLCRSDAGRGTIGVDQTRNQCGDDQRPRERTSCWTRRTSCGRFAFIFLNKSIIFQMAKTPNKCEEFLWCPRNYCEAVSRGESVSKL